MSGSSNANAPFPPSAPTSLQHLRTSSSVGAGAYLYEQYSDDDNVRAFFEAYNIIAEEYVEWFATVALPYWPGLSDGLLDWVANGLYGIYRPTLTFGTTSFYESYGQLPFGNLIPGYGGAGYGQIVDVQQSSSVPVTDDLFQRIMTWHLYRGDGWQFSTNWLKRRVHRFLNGPNGTIPAVQDNTHDVSVTASGVNYTITLQSSAVAGLFALCVSNGVLALPFQYNFTVVQTNVPFAEPIFLTAVTRVATVVQEIPWHPLSVMWRGNATGHYVPLSSQIHVAQETPWHPAPIVYQGSAVGRYVSPATVPSHHIGVSQETPWHPSPTVWSGSATGRYVSPSAGHRNVVVTQEQPWHPGSRTH